MRGREQIMTRDQLPSVPIRNTCQTHFTVIMWPGNVLVAMVKRSRRARVGGNRGGGGVKWRVCAGVLC